MGNSICNCDIKSMDKNGISFQRTDKSTKNAADKNEINNNSLTLMEEETLVKASNKFITQNKTEKKRSFLDDQNNFATQIKNFATIIANEDFEKFYFNILKNANLTPLSESNTHSELNNEDYKTHTNSESHSHDKNNFQSELFHMKTTTAIEFTYDEQKRFYKGSFNADMQKHGYGILINKDNSLYEGYWENDKACGFGRLIDGSGNYYEGNFENIL